MRAFLVSPFLPQKIRTSPRVTSIPPYLLADARARAASAAARLAPSPTTSPNPASPTRPTPLPIPPSPTSGTKPKTTKARTHDAAPTAAQPKAGKGGGNHSGPADPTEVDLEGLADVVAAGCGDASAAAAIRPALPAILGALVKGAQVPGSTGAADRAMLLRLVKHASSTAGEQKAAARSLHVHLGGRISDAMARRAGAVARVVEGRAVEVPSVGHATVAARVTGGSKP
jgi:hypothetical protein